MLEWRNMSYGRTEKETEEYLQSYRREEIREKLVWDI